MKTPARYALRTTLAALALVVLSACGGGGGGGDTVTPDGGTPSGGTPGGGTPGGGTPGGGTPGGGTPNAPSSCTAASPCLMVAPTAQGTGDGSSWDNAIGGLDNALTKASAQLTTTTGTKPSIVKVMLKKGTYVAMNSFVMVNSVEIYGGFAGTEAALADRVLNENNATILDGLQNRSASVNSCTDAGANCITKVINNNYSSTAPLTNSARLDGVTIKNGHSLLTNDSGAGMYNHYASPIVANVIISGNRADFGNGGGMANDASSPTLTNVLFSGNVALLPGGGMANNNASSPTLSNVLFSENYSVFGGGMANNASSPILINVTFLANTANSQSLKTNGGGMYNVTSSPIVINTTFSGNSTTGAGGGVYNDTSSAPLFINSTFINNTATGNAASGGMWSGSPASPILVNATVFDGGIDGASTAYYSLIQGVAGNTNGNFNGVGVSTASVFGTASLADNGNTFAKTIAIATNGPAANNGALVWKSGADYYAKKGDDVYKLNGTGQGKVTSLPTGATLVSTGGANKNNTVTPTAGPPPVYPDLGAYQH